MEIFLGGYHRHDWVSSYPFPAFPQWREVAHIREHSVGRGDVVVGNDVWLGSQGTIIAGVRVADGAVVAARAVVTKDVPPYAVVAGNPARVVRYRFDEELVAGLMRIRWWEWPEAKIRENLTQLLSGDVAGFVARHDAGPQAP